jgi:signal transduction histidine kinase
MAPERATASHRSSPVALVLAPVVAIVVVSIALSVMLVTRHVHQIRAGLIDRARTIAHFMARDAVLGVMSYDHVTLRHLASLAVMQDDVIYATIHDASGVEVARRGEMPPAPGTLLARQPADARGLRLFVSEAGLELRAPLRNDGTDVGQIRLGISHETVDRERRMAITTAITFTVFVAVLASAGAVVFMRRHLATLLTAARLAEEHERVADLKARILTQTAHEFRTPLAVIVGASDVLERYGDRLTSDERRARIEKIRGAVHHMTELLDDVLMLGRTDASRFTPASVDLVELCRQEVGHVRGLAPANVQLTTILPAGPMPATVDAFLLGRVVRALVGNAIRFSPDGGTITVGLEVGDAGIRITVADQGIGIPAEDMHRLFEPFQRGSNVGTIAGAGLGLAIAHRAIAVHGGHIDVRSTPGSGSTFVVSLPATRLATHPGVAAA